MVRSLAGAADSLASHQTGTESRGPVLAAAQALLLLPEACQTVHSLRLTAASAIILPSWPPPRTPTTAVRGRPEELQAERTGHAFVAVGAQGRESSKCQHMMQQQ
jgi:hypothetical protein